MEKKPPRIGIFVCECGGNIGDVIDVKAVIDTVKNWEGVAVAKYHKYLCSKPAQEMILEAIKKENFNSSGCELHTENAPCHIPKRFGKGWFESLHARVCEH